jgi:hypothetical protein
MNTAMTIVALLSASGATLGTVRETVTIPGPVRSVGRPGNAGNPGLGIPGNSVVNATLTGTWNNGGTPTAYTVRQLVVDMTVAGDPGDGAILVTAPGGQQCVIHPSYRSPASPTYSGLVTIPVSEISSVAGNWRFEFFDTWDDDTNLQVDSTFTNVTIGFDDASPVTGAVPSPQGNITLMNVLSDGVETAGFVTRGFSVAGSSGTVGLIRISGTATSLRGDPTTNRFVSAVSGLRFALVRPDGIVTPPVAPAFEEIGGQGYASGSSSSTFKAYVHLPGLSSITGDWVLRAFQSSADIPGGADVGMRNVMLSAVAPPTAASIPVVDGGGWAWVTRSLGAGDVRWFTFTTPTFTTNGALDIDVVGTLLTPTNDTSIGLYDVTGVVIDRDADDGNGLLSQLSYGSGVRNAIGDGERFSGQDGSVGTFGTLRADTQYWLSVISGNSSALTGFEVPQNGTNTGFVTARVRAWSSAAPTDPAPPPANVVDLGNFGPEGATESVVTHSWLMASGQEVKWFRFSTPASVTGAGTAYLDIDTDLTNPGGLQETGNVNDTHIALFDGLGTFRASDDDDGIDQRSALTFGRTSAPRAANVPTAPNAFGAVRNGRDSGGGLNATLAAGTYYVSVATYLPVYSFGFAVTPDARRAATGNRVLAVRTNFAAPVTCTCCSPSNVAGPNQSTTPDNELTADDIIVFLGWFFAGDSRANVAGPNQSTTPDTEWTADDIIVFLARYFIGC